MITLDGYFEGFDHSLEWHNVDEEFNVYAIEQLNSADMLLFGRKTYDLMAGYWPSLAATTDDPIVAYKMNTIPKIVFSRTMDKADWENTKLIKENIKEEITTLKNQKGNNIFIFGSANLVSTLQELNLIDEYRIMINPVIIGQGNSMFANVNHNLNFRLLKTRKFKSGNVLLDYEIKRV